MAQKTKVDHQSILQSFFSERLIERISVSQYNENFILKAMQQDYIKKDILIDALENTARRRESGDLLEIAFDVIEIIETSDTIKKLWENYRQKYHYASEIEFNEVINSIKWMVEYSIA